MAYPSIFSAYIHQACSHPYDGVVEMERLIAPEYTVIAHPRWCTACRSQRQDTITASYSETSRKILNPNLKPSELWHLTLIFGAMNGRVDMQGTDLSDDIKEREAYAYIGKKKMNPGSRAVIPGMNIDTCGVFQRIRRWPVHPDNDELPVKKHSDELDEAFLLGYLQGMRTQREKELAALAEPHPVKRSMALLRTLRFRLQELETPGAEGTRLPPELVLYGSYDSTSWDSSKGICSSDDEELNESDAEQAKGNGMDTEHTSMGTKR
jgi:hypothetical protein